MAKHKTHKIIRQYVIERDEATCCYCDKKLSNSEITLDHIIPASQGGQFNATNLTVACEKHNNSRGDQSFAKFAGQFNWQEDKINKYNLLYINNIKIKVLNTAKTNHLEGNNGLVIPNKIISITCNILNIQVIDYSEYYPQNTLLRFDLENENNYIIHSFEELIKIISRE
jgi:hypothetical protein